MTVRSTDTGRGVHLLHLAEPQRRNPLGLATIASLRAAIEQAATVGARAVVIAADGPVFSAGADLADLTGTAADVAYDDAIALLVRDIAASPMVVLAAVDGLCIGAAVDVVLACDIVVASQAARFEVPATRLGILYNPHAVARLHAASPRATLRALLLGVRLDAERLCQAGLIAATAPAGGALDTAITIAERLADAVPEAVVATKRLLRELDDGSADLDRWQATRLDLLAAPARAAALDAARHRTRQGN